MASPFMAAVMIQGLWGDDWQLTSHQLTPEHLGSILTRGRAQSTGKTCSYIVFKESCSRFSAFHVCLQNFTSTFYIGFTFFSLVWCQSFQVHLTWALWNAPSNVIRWLCRKWVASQKWLRYFVTSVGEYLKHVKFNGSHDFNHQPLPAVDLITIVAFVKQHLTISWLESQFVMVIDSYRKVVLWNELHLWSKCTELYILRKMNAIYFES